ncbi:hypothetical protein [Shewanella waksmanii]|uniref:hypothetical protein n=1 Tax=Shewanella waksmanii TaxID=213783 RepID=UPI000491EA82|nr:hypothetical protein [Shewanella waksmanii]
MFWTLSFWIIAALLILPFPVKIYEYISGRDNSPRIVKIEEMANALFMLVGLCGFYGFLQQTPMLFAEFWYAWLALYVIISLLSLRYSPKLKYSAKLNSCRFHTIAMALGILLYTPMLIAVFYYAQQMPN